jgi:hypothetical protein
MRRRRLRNGARIRKKKRPSATRLGGRYTIADIQIHVEMAEIDRVEVVEVTEGGSGRGGRA